MFYSKFKRDMYRVMNKDVIITKEYIEFKVKISILKMFVFIFID